MHQGRQFAGRLRAHGRKKEKIKVQVGASDWVDQIAVGAVGLVLYPLLVTAAIGAVQQRNVVHEVLDSIDRLVGQLAIE